MRILITGGCGFIGSNLIKTLNLNNLFDITIIDDLSRGSLDYVKNFQYKEFINLDIVNSNHLNDTFKNIDCVIHLAALGSVVESIDYPHKNFKINVEGTFNVLNAARLNKVKKFIFASTGGALMGNTDPPVSESSLPRPISPYGSSKLAGEAYCSSFSESYGMNIIALRFANIVGPNCNHKKGVINNFFEKIHKQENLTIFGDGSSSRDYLHVYDLCDGIIAAINKDILGFNIYHLSSGTETCISTIAEKVIRVAGKKDVGIIYEPSRKGEVENNFASSQLARKELNFIPKYSLNEALRDAYKSIINE